MHSYSALLLASRDHGETPRLGFNGALFLKRLSSAVFVRPVSQIGLFIHIMHLLSVILLQQCLLILLSKEVIHYLSPFLDHFLRRQLAIRILQFLH
jgi:hypothetical protein